MPYWKIDSYADTFTYNNYLGSANGDLTAEQESNGTLMLGDQTAASTAGKLQFLSSGHGTSDCEIDPYGGSATVDSGALAVNCAAVTVTGTTYLGGVAGNESLAVLPGQTGGDYATLTGLASGVGVSLHASSTMAASNLFLAAKGSGAVVLQGNGVSSLVAQAASGSDVNYLQVSANVTGAAPILSVQGADANIALQLTPKGNLPVTVIGGLQSSGAKFTTSGCSISATVGGPVAGRYTSGTTGSCAAVITFGGAVGVTATNGWTCWANDETNIADKQTVTASTTTTVTITGTTVSGDVIDFGCMGY